MLSLRNPATGIIMDRKKNRRNLPKWKKKISIFYIIYNLYYLYHEEKTVGPVKHSSHKAASLM